MITIDVSRMANGVFWAWCYDLPGMMFESGTIDSVVNMILARIE